MNAPRIVSRDIRFVVDCPHTQPGETVAVIGSSDAVGRWNGLFELSTEAQTFPEWSNLTLLSGTPDLEYKFVIVRDRGIVVREEISNRVLPEGIFNGSSNSLVVHATFDVLGEVIRAARPIRNEAKGSSVSGVAALVASPVASRSCGRSRGRGSDVPSDVELWSRGEAYRESSPVSSTDSWRSFMSAISLSCTQREECDQDVAHVSLDRPDSLRGSSVKIETIQRRLALPLRKDDTHKSRSVSNVSLDRLPPDANCDARQWSGRTQSTALSLHGLPGNASREALIDPSEGAEAANYSGSVCAPADEVHPRNGEDLGYLKRVLKMLDSAQLYVDGSLRVSRRTKIIILVSLVVAVLFGALCGFINLLLGGVLGFIMGIFLAPITLGISIIVGAVAGAIIGLIVGFVGGSCIAFITSVIALCGIIAAYDALRQETPASTDMSSGASMTCGKKRKERRPLFS